MRIIVFLIGLMLFGPLNAIAATLYAKTAGGNWGDAATWSNTGSGGGDSSGPPTAADNVIFETGSGNVTIAAAAAARSIDMTSGAGNYAGVLNHDAGFTLSIGDGTAGAGNVALKLVAATYTIDNATTSAISFVSTSATQQGITWAANTHGNLTFNGAAGSWIFNDASTGVGVGITFSAGTLNTNGQTCSWGSIAGNNSGTRTLTLGSSAITLSVANIFAIQLRFTNLTITANTATITFTGAGAGITHTTLGGDYNGASFIFTGAGAHGIDNTGLTFTCANLTVTGTAVKTDTLTAYGSLTITGTFTVNGNSIINRVLVTSNTLGTARTITAAVVTITNTDFRDITGAGAASWDLSAISGGSGDAGGNTMQALGTAAFTTAATQYWVGGTGSWSTAAEWGTTSGGAGGRTPLPQDDVVFDANSFSAGSQTATMDMPRAGKNINWTGVINTPAWAKTTASTNYGSVTMVAGMTNSGTTAFTMEGRGAFTFTSAGLSFTNPLTIAMVGGTVTLQDALNIGSQGLSINNGTFDANDFNIAIGFFNSNATTTKVIYMGSGTWTISVAGGSHWLLNGTGTTLFAETSTIVSTPIGAKTFAGGGLTYNNLTFSGTGVAAITITGSNTFNEFKDIGSAAHSLLFTASTTQTIKTFTVSGSSGNVITLDSTTATNFNLVKSGGGTVSSDWLSIDDSDATPASTWYAGANSTDAGTNSGWIFTVPPSGTVRTMTLLGTGQ